MTTVEQTDTIKNIDTTFVADESPINFSVDTNKTEKKKDELISLAIVDKVPLVKPVLNPSKDIYSGLATVIDSFLYICFFLTPVAFLLLIICLTTKFIDKNARRIIILLDILAFISLLFARSLSWDCERVWGVWVTICSIGVLTIYDIYINRLLRQEQKGSS